jgi:hypothetical protein
VDSDRLDAPLTALGWLFHPSDRSPILELDPDGEIVPVDIERDVDILECRYGRAGS